MKRFFSFFLFFLLFSTISYAISIAPSGDTIPFEAGGQRTFTFSVAGCPCTMDIFDDLAPYAVITSPRVITETTGTTTVQLTFPQTLLPGKHTLIVSATEKKIESAQGVVALGSIRVKINVIVPFPNKYLDADSNLEVSKDNELSKPVHFSITAYNYGQQTIDHVKGTITLYQNEIKPENLITTVPVSELMTLKAGESGKITADWTSTASVKPGMYVALLNLEGDENKLSRDRSFLLGKPELQVVSIDPQKIITTGITKMSITVTSVWNEPITFYADVSVDSLPNVTSATFTLDPWHTIPVPVYLDGTGLSEKNHTLKIVLHYNDLETKKDISIPAIKEKTLAEFQKQLQKEKKQAESSFDIYTVGSVLLIILIVAINGYLFYKRKKIREQ